MKFRATIITASTSGWLVRYFDHPRMTEGLPVHVSRHAFQWSAKLHAWFYMNGWTS